MSPEQASPTPGARSGKGSVEPSVEPHLEHRRETLLRIVEIDAAHLGATELTAPFILEDGHLRVPEGAGIGVDPIEDVLREVVTSQQRLL